MSDLKNFSSSPAILLGSDSSSSALEIRQAMLAAGFDLELASGYSEVESLWMQKRHPVVLLEVSRLAAADSAVTLALGLKRMDPRLFLAYLADPILRSSGLAGDAVLSRDARQIPEALRRLLTSQSIV